MPAESVGLLLYKHVGKELRVLLGHPGGPFWRNRDLGAWTIPKGERLDVEGPETTARREFAEEVGHVPPGP
jgi:predicted NUDIX family NTP pyrophosphohydrolase